MDEMIGAVLTGDILHSMRYDLDMRSIIRDEMDAIFSKLMQVQAYQTALPTPLHLFRGDGWQLLVVEPRQSIKIALTIRAMLRIRFPKEKVDTRISIGIGAVPLKEGKFTTNDGEAFILSGRGLDAIPKRGGSNLMLAVSSNLVQLKELPLAINPMLNALDYLVERWTEKQAIAVIKALPGTKSTTSSKDTGQKNRDRVTRYTLDRAGWRVIVEVLDFYETYLSVKLREGSDEEK